MWLLLTGLATTKVLVLIATPILGLSFIIQDTCKTLFEGVMFAYVVNPFNVGDLCILDGTMVSYLSSHLIFNIVLDKTFKNH